MKVSDLKQLDQVIEEHREDRDFGAEWDRLAFARKLANRVLLYRTEHGLSQRDLAIAGMAQPQIARLENAEEQPTLDTTLAILMRTTGLEFDLP